jgi:transitional endoplasmic reticulum ATPase
MDNLKAQIRRIVETVHVRQEDARRYGVVRNGILLYGPPGCGKTFFAQAMAEEFGLQLVRVSLESAVSKYVGGGRTRCDPAALLRSPVEDTLPALLRRV